MMKHSKTLKWLLCLCCLLAALCAFTLAAHAEIVDSGYCGAEGKGHNLTWTLDDVGTLTISGSGKMEDYGYHSYYGTTTPWGNYTVKIVLLHKGVTSIGDFAFADCEGLTSVTIPDSVTSIGYDAFWRCTGLTSVTIPDSVTSIEFGAFHGCTKLTSVTIPDSVTIIGDIAFHGCAELTTATIGNGVTSLGDSVFYECTRLTSVTIGNSVTNIGNSAFYGCTRLTSVTIPDSVTNIGEYAFYGCTGLMSVTIPDGVTSIGASAFYECTGLTSVTIGNSVTSIGDSAFKKCTGLTSVTIPDSVINIRFDAFSGCTGLMSVIIGNGVTNIGGYAFNNCTKLTSVTIGNGVTSIEGNAFNGCKGLKDVYYRGSETEWEKISIKRNNDDLQNATIHYQFCLHSPGAAVEENVVKPTCTRNGSYASVVYCELCGIELSRRTVSIDAIGHSYGAWEKLNDAQHQRVCANDKSHVEKANHMWDDGKIIAPATCTADGKATFTCTICQATKTDTVSATGHNYGAWEKLDDTQHRRVCANDAAHTETAAHMWDEGSVTKAPSCTAAGETTYICAGCGASVTVPGDAALGHNWSEWTNLDGTSHKRVCANDPTHVETAEHVWDDGTVTTEPTDKVEGVKTFTCTVCGATKTEPIPKVVPKNAPGDVDGDGKLTSADARLALRASVGLTDKGDVEKDSAGYLACDVDGDGKVTSADARLILRASVGLEDAGTFGKKA